MPSHVTGRSRPDVVASAGQPVPSRQRMLARPSRRAPLPLLLSLLVGLPLVGAAITASPAATRTLPPSEVEAFVGELGAALPAADPQVRALRVTVAQEDEDPDEDGLSNAI